MQSAGAFQRMCPVLQGAGACAYATVMRQLYAAQGDEAWAPDQYANTGKQPTPYVCTRAGVCKGEEEEQEAVRRRRGPVAQKAAPDAVTHHWNLLTTRLWLLRPSLAMCTCTDLFHCSRPTTALPACHGACSARERCTVEQCTIVFLGGARVPMLTDGSRFVLV